MSTRRWTETEEGDIHSGGCFRGQAGLIGCLQRWVAVVARVADFLGDGEVETALTVVFDLEVDMDAVLARWEGRR